MTTTSVTSAPSTVQQALPAATAGNRSLQKFNISDFHVEGVTSVPGRVNQFVLEVELNPADNLHLPREQKYIAKIPVESPDMTKAFIVAKLYAQHVKKNQVSIAAFNEQMTKWNPVLIEEDTENKGGYVGRISEYDSVSNGCKDPYIDGVKITASEFKAIDAYAKSRVWAAGPGISPQEGVNAALQLTQTSGSLPVGTTTIDATLERTTFQLTADECKTCREEWKKHSKALKTCFTNKKVLSQGKQKQIHTLLNQTFGPEFVTKTQQKLAQWVQTYSTEAQKGDQRIQEEYRKLLCEAIAKQARIQEVPQTGEALEQAITQYLSAQEAANA
jgi:hypothetical protein